MIVEIVVIAAVIGVIVWFVSRSTRRSSWRAPERQLERMVGRDAAERLVRYEKDRDPKLSHDQAAKRALDRAEYDRGR
jgi:hypothetical protein